MCQGMPHVGCGVPDVVVRPHFIHVLGEIGNGTRKQPDWTLDLLDFGPWTLDLKLKLKKKINK